MTTSTENTTTSTGITPTVAVDLPPLTLMILSVEWRWDSDSKYTEIPTPDTPAEQMQPIGDDAALNNDSWKEYCFVVAQTRSTGAITFKIFLMSPYIIKACRDVMVGVPGISWDSYRVRLNPKTLVAYFPRLEQYEQNLAAREDRTQEDSNVLKSLGILLTYMRKNYKQTLAHIAHLADNHEITFDLLYTILLPDTVIVTHCPITREIRAFRLLYAEENMEMSGRRYWRLRCEYLESVMGDNKRSRTDVGRGNDSQAGQPIEFGMLNDYLQIFEFEGVEKISSLDAYPIEFHQDTAALEALLLKRARKWVSLCGVHHVDYKGTAGRSGNVLGRYSVHSRIMVDKANFSRMNDSYFLPEPKRILSLEHGNSDNGAHGLADAELLLAPPIVYGFSLADNLWLEFNVNYISKIVWNDEAFAELVLPAERKELLRGLIEDHSRNAEGTARFDDFVQGKGQGLVINLFGPPGVGKTLSAEATSEHVRCPLYILGSGDLGTSARSLHVALRQAFELAVLWRVVLLIDEADVFLEQRSPNDLDRNAMVAVFLRHMEYYRGILFLTTNRIQAFDEAFLSRIHVALHFGELSIPAKVHIWRAFLKKAGLEEAELEEEGLLLRLAARNINGRQIKNACRTATSLAANRGEKMSKKDLEKALNVMEDFTKDFTREQNAGQQRDIGEDITRFGPISQWGKRLVYHIYAYLTGF